jgi:hypothetical protein
MSGIGGNEKAAREGEEIMAASKAAIMAAAAAWRDKASRKRNIEEMASSVAWRRKRIRQWRHSVMAWRKA